MHRSSVLLPEPLGPEQRGELPGLDANEARSAALHRELARAEGLGKVRNLDDVCAGQPPSASEAGVRSACQIAMKLAATPPASITAKVRIAVSAAGHQGAWKAAHGDHQRVGHREAAEGERERLLEDHAHDHAVRRADQLQRGDRP